MAAQPVEETALSAVWRAAAAAPLCVAVSGGGDSLALLALLRRHAPDQSLRALIVDHAIQPTSAEVAQEAARRACALGVDAEVITLRWSQAPPGGHAALRAARYRALTKAMRRAGGRILALGHTQDDQAETALIKHARTGAWTHAPGMAAFAPLPDWPFGFGLWVARPLLHARREALRAWLRGQGLAWRDDPLNDAPRYQRTRARGLIAAGFGPPERLADLAVHLRLRQSRREAAAFQALAKRAEIADGEAWFDPNPDQPTDLRAMAALCAAVAGAEAGPVPKALASAVRKGTATLAGVMLRPARGGVHLMREPASLAGRAGVPAMPPLALTAGKPALVDQRLLIWAQREGLKIGPDPKAGLVVFDQDARLALNGATGMTIRWLTHAHLRHQLAPGDPFIPCHDAEGVQRALGLLS
jgi:tRNA(Ile)-lysidine synthase